MVNRISLDRSTSASLLYLQQVGRKMARMHSILATGCCTPVSAENPSSYYTARALTNRARDLDALLDSMSQKAQILNAALTGIEAATFYLEQMSSVAEQAILSAGNVLIPVNVPDDPGGSGGTGESGDPGGTGETGDPSGTGEPEDPGGTGEPEDPGGTGEPEDPGGTGEMTIDDYIAEGYQVVSSSTTTEEFQALLDAGEKIVLDDNIVIDSGLEITQSAIINGNGHTITFATTYGDAIIQASGEDVVIDISNLDMEVSGAGAAAIQVMNGATVRIDSLDSITVSDGAMRILNGTSASYNGKANTAAYVAQLGNKALAAYAATQFYAPGVDKTDADFGQGQWYIPSLGELMEVYGTDYDAISEGDGTTGATKANKTILNNALSKLASKGVNAAKISEKHYWSSSELPNAHIWRVNMQTGGRGEYSKANNKYIRFFQRIEGGYDPTDTESTAPIVGDVMYADKSYGSANDYDGTKVAVGVITQVSADGAITIMSLKDARFSATNAVGNFDPDNPFTGSQPDTYFTTSGTANQNITGIDDYDLQTELDALKSLGTIEITGTSEEEEEEPMDALAAPFSPQMSPLSLGNRGLRLMSVDPLAADPPAEDPPIEDPPIEDPPIEDPPDDNNEENTVNFDRWSEQYNELLAQYNDLINDSNYRGINLLKGDTMNIAFNESHDHNLTVTGTDVRSSALGLANVTWSAINDITASIKELRSAVTKLRTVASDIGNNALIVKVRQSFTENLINILEEGADKLTLADMNDASAEYLMLQTRQALAINAMSLATEAKRSVLMLF